MKITSKGQITIPQEIRTEFGLMPNTEVDFKIRHGQVILFKKKSKNARMDKWLQKARGKAKTHLKTDQILKMTRGK